MSLYPPGATFCKHCGYCLYALTVNRCPECGHEFDPANPKTFRTRPRRAWPRRVIVWGTVLVLMLAVVYGGFLGWLYMGWKAEAGARAVAEGPNAHVRTMPILPSALSSLLVGDCCQWQERVAMVSVRRRPLSAGEIASIADCRRLTILILDNVPLKAEDIAMIQRCRGLEELELATNGLSENAAAPLSALTGLKGLSIKDNAELGDSALEAAGRLPELRSLYLGGIAITDDGLAHLSPLQKLESLDLRDCPQLTAAAVPHLSRLKGLGRLVVVETHLTPAAVAQLRQALPKCAIYGPPSPADSSAPATGTVGGP